METTNFIWNDDGRSYFATILPRTDLGKRYLQTCYKAYSLKVKAEEAEATIKALEYGATLS